MTARLPKLADANLFPVLETAYPEQPKPSPTVAEQLIPKTMAKLKAGGKVSILAWGDSVTDGGYLPDRDATRWQEQFARPLMMNNINHPNPHGMSLFADALMALFP